MVQIQVFILVYSVGVCLGRMFHASTSVLSPWLELPVRQFGGKCQLPEFYLCNLIHWVPIFLAVF